ncbi:hypothetical protein Csa_023535, partial [Cucumis sativus]
WFKEEDELQFLRPKKKKNGKGNEVRLRAEGLRVRESQKAKPNLISDRTRFNHVTKNSKLKPSVLKSEIVLNISRKNARGDRRRRTPIDGTNTEEEQLFKNTAEDLAPFRNPARSSGNRDGGHLDDGGFVN